MVSSLVDVRIMDNADGHCRPKATIIFARNALSRQSAECEADFLRQGPWNVDLRTPPGPEGSNGSLLCICRGHPDIFSNDEGRMNNVETKPVRRVQNILASSFFILHSSFAFT